MGYRIHRQYVDGVIRVGGIGCGSPSPEASCPRSRCSGETTCHYQHDMETNYLFNYNDVHICLITYSRKPNCLIKSNN